MWAWSTNLVRFPRVMSTNGNRITNAGISAEGSLRASSTLLSSDLPWSLGNWFLNRLAHQVITKKTGIEIRPPINKISPKCWSIWKMPATANGPGVGGIKIWDRYNPPAKERLKVRGDIPEV